MNLAAPKGLCWKMTKDVAFPTTLRLAGQLASRRVSWAAGKPAGELAGKQTGITARKPAGKPSRAPACRPHLCRPGKRRGVPLQRGPR